MPHGEGVKAKNEKRRTRACIYARETQTRSPAETARPPLLAAPTNRATSCTFLSAHESLEVTLPKGSPRYRRKEKRALGRTLFSTAHSVLFNPHIRTDPPFLLSKQRAPRCSFAAWRFPQVSICTESPVFHRGGFSSEIPRFRIGHCNIGLVFVVGNCTLQLRATGKHIF